MSVGKDRAFARQPALGKYHWTPEQDGMTYREWLIGQALAGVMANTNWTGAIGDASDQAIRAADAVIAKLDKEKP